MFKTILLSLVTISVSAAVLLGQNDVGVLADGISLDHISPSTRGLQEDSTFQGDMGAINVAALCGGFMAEGVLDCECQRSGALDVKAECKQIEPQCTLDNSTCLELRFETVRTPLTPDTQGSVYTTSCTNWIMNKSCAFEACVEVEPVQTGNFSGQVKCGASLAGKFCRSCTQCNTPWTSVTVDCENIERGAKMTCGNVTGDIGLSVLAFDAGYPPVEGTQVGCEGSAASSLFSVGFILAILLSSLCMLLAW